MLDIRSPTPPSIAFILAAGFMMWGIVNNNVMAVIAGGAFVMIGVGLQVLYLHYRYGGASERARLAKF